MTARPTGSGGTAIAPMKQQAGSADGRREQMLRAALEIIAERGYPETRITDVAAQAAVNAGYGGETAGKILYAASHALCPDTAAAVDKWGSTP